MHLIQLDRFMIDILRCYLQMMDHEKALHIFVHNLKDFNGAEMYCNQMTEGKPRREKEQLLLLYLTALLNSSETR